MTMTNRLPKLADLDTLIQTYRTLPGATLPILLFTVPAFIVLARQ